MPRQPMLAMLVALAAFALVNLFSVWWVEASIGWTMFWMGLIGYTIVLAVRLDSDVRHISGPNPVWDSDEALVVRAAAVAPDDQTAPLAQTQPEMPAEWPEAADSLPISGLYRPERLIPLDSSRVATLGLTFVVGVMIIGVQLFILSTSHGPDFAAWSLTALLGVVIAQSLWELTQRLRMSQPFSVVVDTQGLTWSRGGKRRTLPWSAAQALCMIELPPIEAQRSRPAAVRPHIYWIQAPDGALTWTSGPHAQGQQVVRASQEANTPDAPDDPAWRLCALAAARTGLPLRNLTASVARLAQLRPDVSLIRQTLEPGPSLQISEADQRRIATQRAKRRKQAWTRFGLGVAFDVIMLAAAATLLFVAPRAYGDQLAQAQRSVPIFADSLAAPSGQWASTSGPDATFTYSGHAMTQVIDSSCCDFFTLATPIVRDGVIEVTRRQLSNSDLDAAGLVFRADSTTHEALVFYIYPGGAWQLTRFSLNAEGSSGEKRDTLIFGDFYASVSAIHRGTGATNRLAVIMRGASYTFFVNGQYLGSYHDDRVTGGHVGLYAAGIQDATAFTDFAIYPAPPAFLASGPGVSSAAAMVNGFAAVC